MLSEHEQQRRKKLDELIQLGINPYPPEAIKVSDFSSNIIAHFEQMLASSDAQQPAEKYLVSIAGRIMSVRDMGKAAFAVLQDKLGTIQIYIRKDDICPASGDTTLYDQVWKKLIDIGDIVSVEGYVFRTKMGEVSVHVTHFTLLSKSLKPLPIVKEADGEVFDQVTNAEFKYRQRYAHLIIEPSIKEVFIKRTKIVNAIRAFLNDVDMLEVETPVLQSIPGGATARSFVTHHNTLDMPLYLRIANELYLKRLIVGGLDAVYEFSRNFRNEGMDRTHNPEFTILEMYAAYKDYYWMMHTTEQLLATVAQAVNQSPDCLWDDKHISLTAPFQRITFYDAIHRQTGENLMGASEDKLRQLAKKIGIADTHTMHEAKLLDEIFSAVCEPLLIQPTFIMDYPLCTSPLTKKHRDNPQLVERFELFIGGKEIANAYSELNDPLEQRKRFEEQANLLHGGDDEAMRIDYDFLRALEYGMPPCSGIGIGIDRLVMLLTGQRSIQDVLFFPQMRIEKMH